MTTYIALQLFVFELRIRDKTDRRTNGHQQLRLMPPLTLRQRTKVTEVLRWYQ